MRMTMQTLLTTVALAALALAVACSDGDATPSGVGDRAVAALHGADGDDMGEVTLVQAPGGVLLQAEVRGLTPGPHGFHIHETGACAPDFSAAGGHFAPEGRGHGLLHAEDAHAGDLPNIHADDTGVARADYFTAKVTLDAGAAASLFDDDGSAIIVHAKPDSYGADPGAGDRVACGVIERR